MNTFEPADSESIVISNYPRKETLPQKTRLSYLADALSGSWIAFGVTYMAHDLANRYLHLWIRSYPLSIHVTKIVIVLALLAGLPFVWRVLLKIEAAEGWKRLKTAVIFVLIGALMVPIPVAPMLLIGFCLLKLRQAGIKLRFGVEMEPIRRQVDALEDGVKNRQI